MLSIEIGYNLIPLVDPKSEATFLDQVNRLRKSFAMETGLRIPLISIRDNMNLDPNVYAIKLHGTIVGESILEPDKLLAINTGNIKEKLSEAVVKDPSFGLEAHWIDIQLKSTAEKNGYQVVDPSTVIVTHLSNVIQRNAASIMRRKEVKSMLDSVREEDSIIVDEVINDKKLSLGQIQAVLANLLKENVSIRSMPQILTVIADNAERTQKDPILLNEAVRFNLRKQIVAPFLESDKTLKCIFFSPNLEQEIRENLQQDPTEGFVMTHSPVFQEAFKQEIARAYKSVVEQGKHPIFLCNRSIRIAIFQVLERLFDMQNFTVLSYDELSSDVKVEKLEILDLNSQKSKEAHQMDMRVAASKTKSTSL